MTGMKSAGGDQELDENDDVRKPPDNPVPIADASIDAPQRQERTMMPGRNASKTYGTVSADRQKAMSGLEFVQGLADGTLPLNTIAQTLGYDVAEAASGRVVVTAKPSGIHLNPAGTVHGGLAATLLDSCMGLAVQSTLEESGAHAKIRERVVLSFRGGGAGGRLSPLPALPAGSLARACVLARHLQHRVARAGVDRIRRARRRRCRGPCQPARRRRAAITAAVRPACRGVAGHGGADPAGGCRPRARPPDPRPPCRGRPGLRFYPPPPRS